MVTATKLDVNNLCGEAKVYNVPSYTEPAAARLQEEMVLD